MEPYQIIVALCAIGSLLFAIISFIIGSNRSINKKLADLEIAIRVLEAILKERQKK